MAPKNILGRELVYAALANNSLFLFLRQHFSSVVLRSVVADERGACIAVIQS